MARPRLDLGLLVFCCGLGYGHLLIADPLAKHAPSIETITVTATRSEQDLSSIPASISIVDQAQLDQISAVHISEALATVPGVWITRGNGQEHLTAIRSPVLTGAGSCGAFAVTEEGVPVRATGFCNVNQLFDLNYEQAQQIDVLRGPGTVLFGSDAQHGVINVISAAASDGPNHTLGLEAGANDYARLKLGFNRQEGEHGLGLRFNAAHDGGYKDDSGFDQQKLSLRHDYATTQLKASTLLSVNNLNQETAGYVSGADAYKDKSRQRENPNPEAFRDSQSARLQSRIDIPLGNAKRHATDQTNIDANSNLNNNVNNNASILRLTPYARYTDMTFMMHFLPGTPVEQNGHKSLGLQTLYLTALSDDLDLTAGLDTEYTHAWLTQSQVGGFSSFPAGKQYDYTVQALLAAAFTALEYRIDDATLVTGGLRYEYLGYDYNNKMISGDSAEDGSLCINNFTGAVGCRYTRPEDSKDAFKNFSTNLALLRDLTEQHRFFIRLAEGNRAPQATEMYRLQNGQMHAELQAEEILSAELGLGGQFDNLSYNITAFRMAKDNVIFQSADRLNLGNGKTDHLGTEYELHWQVSEQWRLSFSGTLAQHHYQSNVSAPGTSNELKTKGNTIVSAPKHMHSLRLNWLLSNASTLELEWLAMGSYYTNLENTHRYDGHNLVNARFTHRVHNGLSFGLRVKNLTDNRYAERADFSSFDGDRYFIGEPRSLFASLELTY
ncbi:TonB-dependent receptor [Simiduia curdlanivorans]|uniref:TonB-dependent receptor n=1 Tax=Simiduia curdlanivorans TaxID=1492769 RepID=A0ABV8V167_9GAMM|nr:TonB-dependent receptor [Simiduia curdlanivorans]MDN3637525.1 TonB-dependent receptor [Simiduia curdlanivorans]